MKIPLLSGPTGVDNFQAMALRIILSLSLLPTLACARAAPPNIVYIMADELAYFELGHMGNPYIKTPISTTWPV